MIKIELIGMVAGGCTTFAFIPQVAMVWRTRSTKDISLGMYTTFCTGLLLWLIYGILINSISLIISNAITLMLASSILYMKILWEIKPSPPKKKMNSLC